MDRLRPAGRWSIQPHAPPRRRSVATVALALLATSVDVALADRVDDLLAALTLDEKVALLHGAEDPLTAIGSPAQRGAGYLPGVPRLGIPPLRLTDGPAGIRTGLPATAMPAPMALAASFDVDLARRFGAVLGREARANNQDVVLGPMVDIARVPVAGRNFETLSEDPLLAGRIAAAEVAGIEAQGVIATVKHLGANHQEDHRQATDARIDSRTLREIYLPAFAAAGASAAMCGYHKVNGVAACENAVLLDGLLRGELGFRGFVMSDWGATHSSLASLAAGLDLEMWSGKHFGGLAELVRAGVVTEARLDQSVRRILAAMARVGLLDGQRDGAVDHALHRQTAREVALAGAVLLRNEDGLLPLQRGARVAVIGPSAARPLTGGGGSSRVPAAATRSALDALRERLGDAITYAVGLELDGEVIPATALRDLRGQPATLDLTVPPGTRWRWTGRLTAPATGPYELLLQAGPLGQDVASPWVEGGRAWLRVDGFTVAEAGGVFGGGASLLPTADGLGNAVARLHFDAGATHRVTVTAEAHFPVPLRLRLAWVTPELRERRIAAAAAAAHGADVAVVFAFDEASEGHDRPSLSLPGAQDRLIEAVAAANPRTVVVLSTAGPVLMPWLERTAAVLQTWYPGVDGGPATAALLCGEASPSGRLPMTFPADASRTPTSPPERYPGRGGVATYGEGLLVGYRWYDAQGETPLFPFGHGLSYARFGYDDLKIARIGDAIQVSFTLRNDGPVAAAEVPQLYVGRPDPPPVPMPPRALADFTRVVLGPGERRGVTLRADRRSLSYWSEAAGRWELAKGARPLWIGASSRDLRLAGHVEVP